MLHSNSPLCCAILIQTGYHSTVCISRQVVAQPFQTFDKAIAANHVGCKCYCMPCMCCRLSASATSCGFSVFVKSCLSRQSGNSAFEVILLQPHVQLTPRIDQLFSVSAVHHNDHSMYCRVIMSVHHTQLVLPPPQVPAQDRQRVAAGWALPGRLFGLPERNHLSFLRAFQLV